MFTNVPAREYNANANHKRAERKVVGNERAVPRIRDAPQPISRHPFAFPPIGPRRRMNVWALDPQMRREWRLAWTLPLVSAVGYGVGVAHNYSFGLFILPLEHEFGWSRSAISIGLMMYSVINVGLSFVLGMLIDRFGARRIALPGMTFYCAAIAGLSLVGSNILSWWALWLLLGTASLMVNSTLWSSAVVSRFDRSRGLALAITLCGGGVSAVFVPLLTSKLLTAFDWRLAYVGLGAVLALVALPALFLFFRDRHDIVRTLGEANAEAQVVHVSGYSIREALGSPHYLRLAGATTFMLLCLMAMFINLVPILVAHGVASTSAAGIAGLAGMGSIIGRLCAGWLLDRISGAVIGGIAFGMPMVVALLLLLGGPPFAIPAAFLLGVTVGTEIDVIGYLTSRYFGMRNYGAVFGSMIGLMSLSTGLGPLIGNLIYDRFGSYDWLLIGVVPVFALCSLVIFSMGPYPVFETGAGTKLAEHG